MSTATISAVTVTPTFEIVETTYGGFKVLRDGVPLVAGDGSTRVFATRSSARKRISRELRGDFHR